MSTLDIIREEVVREIEGRIPTEDARWVGTGRCVQATHVGLETLRHFGIQAKPLMTLLLTGNAEWAAWMGNNPEEPMPEEAWSVGIDASPTMPGFPGHLVVEIDGQLLDLDAGFYARPQHRIHIPPSVLIPLTPAGDGLAGLDLEEGGVLLYGRHYAPPNFYATNAWKHTGTWAGPVIRRVKART